MKKRDKIEGNTLYEKFKNLYLKNPDYTNQDYIQLLDVTKEQCYSLRWKMRKELQETPKQVEKEIDDIEELKQINSLEVWEEPSFDFDRVEKISPIFDIHLQGVDGVTIQNFLRILLSPEKTNSNKKYILDIKLVEQ